LSLVCLMGGSAAQIIETGEGYSSSQLAFFNSPSVPVFEPNVQKYWSTYVKNNMNSTLTMNGNPSSTMNIWRNTFPLGFQEPITLSKSTFSAGISNMDNVSPSQWNSEMLRRNTLYSFSSSQSWKYTPVYTPSQVQRTSFSLIGDSGNITYARSSSQILTQGITTLFNT
jgi:hypothetical protein